MPQQSWLIKQSLVSRRWCLWTSPSFSSDLNDVLLKQTRSNENVMFVSSFFTVWDGGGHWLVAAGVAAGNSPHRIATVVMGTDEKVSRAFPHQTLQLLQGGTHKVNPNHATCDYQSPLVSKLGTCLPRNNWSTWRVPRSHRTTKPRL